MSRELYQRTKAILQAQPGATLPRRLVRLFTEGGLPVEILEEQRRELSRRRAALEDERQRLEPSRRDALALDALRGYLPAYSEQVRRWIEGAKSEELELLLRATDAQVTASRAEAHIKGAIP